MYLSQFVQVLQQSFSYVNCYAARTLGVSWRSLCLYDSAKKYSL